MENKNLILKYVFLFFCFSFIGRLYEFDLIISSGTLNYLAHFPTAIYTLIFALPYGVAGLLLYFTVRFLDKNKFTSNLWIKILACIIVINLVELLIGLFALNVFGVMPWNYSHHLLNYRGLISLPITIRWLFFSVIFNMFAYKKIKSFIKNPLSEKIKRFTIATFVLYVIYLMMTILFRAI